MLFFLVDAETLHFPCKMFISNIGFLTLTLQSITEPMLKIVANVIPVLNGRDAAGNIIYLGPQTTKIHRYLIVIFLAKATQMFRLMGKEMDNSVYFTLYGLGKVAESFKQIGPYHIAIHYDRTKVATRIYNMISNTGLVAVKKMGGDTYITITDKGEDVSAKLLQELIAYEEFANMNKKQITIRNLYQKGLDMTPD
jgi:predicted transcriptional regulator